MSTGSYTDTQQAQIDKGTRADYDDLKEMTEGEAIISFGMDVIDVKVFYANPGAAKAMRVSRYLALPEQDETFVKHSTEITKLRDLLCSKDWTAMKADVAMETPEEIEALQKGFALGIDHYENAIDHGITALSELHALQHPVEAQEAIRNLSTTPEPEAPAAPPQAPKAQPTAAVPAPETTQETQTVSWDSLVAEEEPETAPPPSPPVAAIKKKLSADVEKILKDAGGDLRKALFKSGDDDDSIDAAE